MKILIRNELWFGFPNFLNDTFEGQFRVLFEGTLPNDDFLKRYYLDVLKIEEAVNERIDRNKKNIEFFLKDIQDSIQQRIINYNGVCSFSKKYDDTKMWSHYADSHFGICMVFDKDILIKSLMGVMEVKHSEIDYSDELPKVKIISTSDNISYEGLDSFKILNTKLIGWKDEQEIRFSYRFSDSNQKRSLKFDRKAIRGIIFGEKILNENIGTLVHLMKEKNDIFWAKAIKDFQKSKMDIIYCHPEIHNYSNDVQPF